MVIAIDIGWRSNIAVSLPESSPGSAKGGFSERLLAALFPVPESIASLGDANQARVLVLRRFLRLQTR
jgi:hypothetical protein